MSQCVSSDIFHDYNRKLRLHVYIIDFANIFKAFIGSSFLSIPFGFGQCGLALGMVGLMVIATVTAHCCHLLVKCKYHAIQHLYHLLGHPNNVSVKDRHRPESCFSWKLPCPKLITDHLISHDIVPEGKNDAEVHKHSQEVISRLMKTLQYGDLAHMCLGKWGLILTRFVILITQVGFCINYAIFTATAVQSFFPAYNCSVKMLNNELFVSDDCQYLDNSTLLPWLEMQMMRSKSGNDSVSAVSALNRSDITAQASSPNPVSLVPMTVRTSQSLLPSGEEVQGSSVPNQPQENSWNSAWTNSPDIRLLFLIPVAAFLVLVLPRQMRVLGIISAVGNLTVVAGAVVMFIAVMTQFHLSNSWQWARLEGLPIFFGVAASTFEGTGAILDVEASMDGNRHNFAPYLWGSIILAMLLHYCLCVSSYLSFGSSISQIVSMNIEGGSGLDFSVNTCLMVGLIFTFPLMIFPAVQMSERMLLGEDAGCLCNKRKKNSEDMTMLIHDANKAAGSASVQTSLWKGNVLRISLVLLVGILGLLLRDNFAYISAFIGALGSTFVAFILPCVFHIRLCWSQLPLFIKVKDLSIAVTGIVFCITGIYTVIKDLTDL